jgi:hypothetical protein
MESGPGGSDGDDSEVDRLVAANLPFYSIRRVDSGLNVSIVTPETRAMARLSRASSFRISDKCALCAVLDSLCFACIRQDAILVIFLIIFELKGVGG